MKKESKCGRLLVAGLAIFLVGTLAMTDARVAKVYFLVGQSNMEGKGNPVHLDTYRDDPMIAEAYAGLKDGDGWAVRDDVWITYPSKAQGAKHGPLTVGYGTKGEDSIGPEFGFGHTVGNAVEEPVVLIKVAWGGKSLAVGFRPPGAPPSEAELDAMLEKARKKKPETTRAEVVERYGHFYREMVRLAKEELENLDKRFPEIRGYEPEVAGFVWHQGFNDKINGDLRSRQFEDYTKWLVQLVSDVREEFGVPDMPFVIGELSTGGIPQRGDFQAAQEAAADEGGENVFFVPTAEYYDTEAQELYEKGYWKGTDEEKAQWQAVGNDRPYHYLGSGKTYYLKGAAFGEALTGEGAGVGGEPDSILRYDR
ncbi:MAG: sialate O-acetylesterase [Verrucomicrobiota bacterium]